jgi:putative endonuclease
LRGAKRRGNLQTPTYDRAVPEQIVAVYILTNEWNTTLYTGVTSNLEKRMWEHKTSADPEGFAARYQLTKLVYFEATNDIRVAIAREKQIKAGSRKKKIALVESMNPDWKDLSLGMPV